MPARRAVMLGGLALLGARPAWAQRPPTPYAYILGTDIARDALSAGKIPVPDGRPDLWLRANFRNLGYYLGRPGWGLFVKHMVLRTLGGSQLQWDTIPYSGHPLLLVESDGKRVNRTDGSVAGFSPPDDASVDLFVADNGSVLTRHIPLELEVVTLDGPYKINVALFNDRDVKPL